LFAAVFLARKSGHDLVRDRDVWSSGLAKRIVESESEHNGNRRIARLSTMKKAKEYLQYGGECRELAARPSNSEHKNALLEMAATWSHIAADRKAGNVLHRDNIAPGTKRISTALPAS
jgi:hypothetical protein